MHATLDSLTGTLLVQGLPNVNSEQINVVPDGSHVKVTVGATTERFPAANVKKIVVVDRGDSVTIDPAYYDRLGKPNEAAPFLARRVVRIYPLYWLATAAVLAISWSQPGLTARDKFDAAAIAKSIALWPQSEYPIVAVGWTLSYEMFFYLAFAGLLLLPRRTLPPALLLWSLVTVALFAHHTDPAYKLTADGHLSLPLYASPLALEFIAGCFVGLAVKRGVTSLARLPLATALALLLLVGGYVGQHFPREAHYGLARASLFGGAATLITYGAVGLERREWLRVPRWLVFWGDASYSTYLTHMYVLWLLAAVWPAAAAVRSSAPLGDVDSWLRTASAIALCGCVAAACHVAVERPLHRLLVRRLALSTASGRIARGTAP